MPSFPNSTAGKLRLRTNFPPQPPHQPRKMATPAPRCARDGRLGKNYNPAAAFRAAALSVRSQLKPSPSVRPKWPYAAVSR
jgi:hypothetical protein